jgi:hypothetical protein
MTHALTNWLCRLVSTATHSPQDPPETRQPPMKIEIEPA